MTTTLTKIAARNIIEKLLASEDYRIEVVNLINAQFLQYVINFFKQVVNAKLNNQRITSDWYKENFLDDSLSKEDIAIHSGLNVKTISNMYNSTAREVVIEASNEHYDELYESIKKMSESDSDLNVNLTIKLKDVSVELDLTESLIVINTLAVKRAALRGGLWSTAGKRVEKPLMLTLCKLYGVPETNYAVKSSVENDASFEREIDFYLVTNSGEEHKCEVKLMGNGNPESADAVIARSSKVFVADKLSETNKAQLDSLEVEWVELRDPEVGFRKFKTVLTALGIPHHELSENYQKTLSEILDDVLV